MLDTSGAWRLSDPCMKQLIAFVMLRPRFFAFACAAGLITVVVAMLTYQQTGALALALAWGLGTGLGALGCVMALRISLLIRPVVKESQEVRQESERVRTRFAFLERRLGQLSARFAEDGDEDANPRT